MILAVTPVRGGSRRVPRKNARTLCGKPLIAWTIEFAQAATCLDRYVVSTEDEELAALARRYGAEVLPRPAALAADDVTTAAVLQHVVEVVPADIVVLLQATSPVRDAGLIDRCVERFLATGADSLATGFMCRYVEYGRKPESPDGFFYDDGNVYVMRADNLRKGDRYGTRIERMLLDRDQNLDIDDEFDFWLAEQIIRRRLPAHE